MSDKLKPCPFRGGVAVDYTAADDSCQKWEENDEREAEGMPVLRRAGKN